MGKGSGRRIEDIQPDINMVKEHNNKLERARRIGR